MVYDILKTGSSGNCIIINSILALDMGIPFKRLGKYAKSLKLVFISHRHSDHFNPSTIKKLHTLRPTVRFCVGDFLYQKLIDIGINKKNIDIIKHNNIYDYKILKLMPCIAIHDVRNYGLHLFIDGEKLLYITDTSKIDHIKAFNYNYYLLEANYDIDKLEANIKEDEENGVYCYCKRVKETHLSIQQASDFIMKNISDKGIYELIHTSERNA